MAKEFKSFFKTVGARGRDGKDGGWCRYNTRLDTYGCGCTHDCQYCYAKSLLEFRGLWNTKEPNVADIGKIEKKIATLKKQGFNGVLRLGGMTDCFQACETEHRVTYNTIRLLNDARINYLIVTKSHLIATDKYLEILDPDLAHIQISVTSTDDKQALAFEKASLTSKRLDALRTLQSLGGQIDVCLRLSPYFEQFIDKDILAQYEPRKILVEFLRINHFIAQWLSTVGIFDLSRYSLHYGGYQHLSLDDKIKQIDELKKAFPCSEITIGESVPEHYLYWRDNVNPNKEDCCNLTFKGGKMEKQVKFEMRKVSDLIPYAMNARTHSDEQITRVASSIKEFGFLNPVIISDDNGILAGHCRVLAAKKLGLEQVPCILENHLTDTQKKAYILADNKLALDSDWDVEILRNQIDFLSGEDFDLDKIGFKDFDIDAIDADGFFDEEAQVEKSEEPKKIKCPNCGAEIEI